MGMTLLSPKQNKNISKSTTWYNHYKSMTMKLFLIGTTMLFGGLYDFTLLIEQCTLIDPVTSVHVQMVLIDVCTADICKH